MVTGELIRLARNAWCFTGLRSGEQCCKDTAAKWVRMLVTLEKFYARKGMGTTISFVKLWRHSHRSFLFCGNKLKLKQIMLPFQESVYRTSFDTHFTNLAGITKRSSKALNPPSMRTHFTAVSAASEEQYSNCGKVCNPYDAWENVSVMTREGKVQESNLFFLIFL